MVIGGGGVDYHEQNKITLRVSRFTNFKIITTRFEKKNARLNILVDKNYS